MAGASVGRARRGECRVVCCVPFVFTGARTRTRDRANKGRCDATINFKTPGIRVNISIVIDSK